MPHKGEAIPRDRLLPFQQRTTGGSPPLFSRASGCIEGLACGRLRRPEFFSTWLTRILLNACADELRRQRREIAFAQPPETAAPDYDALPLRDAVARLPQELRAVVVLRYFSGYTLAETAEILSLPAGTVSTRYIVIYC